jgi:hypothetical protein
MNMGHNVGDQANRAVKKSEKKSADALRTPEERLSAIRSSLAAKLFVTPDDVRFLLGLYDGRMEFIDQVVNPALETTRHDCDNFAHQVVELQAKLDEFRTVYEQENRSTTVTVERVLPESVYNALTAIEDPTVALAIPPGEVHPLEIDRFHDDGAPVYREHGGEA